ncbi:MAG: DUF3037 domain-containing protein [Anditalea sp.]
MGVVPHVEREEFLNVGIILFCSKQGFLKILYELDEERLMAFYSHLDIQEPEEYLRAFIRISNGGPESGPIGRLSIAERFRWLTAVRSTIVQTSPVHPGLCMDAQQTLDKLHSQLVLNRK